jgi:cell surface protein SprA
VKKAFSYSVFIVLCVPFFWSFSPVRTPVPINLMQADTTDPDSLPYPMNPGSDGGLYLNTPNNYNTEVVYDPETGQYIIYERIGNLLIKPPMVMTPEEYREYIYNKQKNDYWTDKVASTSKANEANERSNSSLIPQIRVRNEAFGKVFGSDIIEIRPQGAAEIRFGVRYQKVENPALPIRNQRTFNFDFDQRIQMNVTGKIGDRLQLGINYDTEATFAFENRMKLEYEGDEDEIIKRLEMGNVNLPVNSSLITGAQSLFGVKGQFQFGKTMVTAVFSEQRSQSQSINVQGGGTLNEYEIWADQYEANRHFFLAQYFRNEYESSLQTMPVINSTVQITRMEVWVTNERSSTQDLRNIVAFMDLGESEDAAYRNNGANLPGYQLFPGPASNQFGYPNNQNNDLDPTTLAANIPGVRDIATANGDLVNNGLEEASEFIEIANARKLEPNQYSFHPQLGYITLNQSLNQDEVLAVAYQYTANGRTFQVGEFSNDGVTPPKTLILKMLKSTILNVKIPLWDLMMKNVYSLGAFQVDREDFYLEIAYWNDETGVPIPFLPSGNLKNELLLRVMEMDRLNNNNDPQPDGIFDFVEGITITPRNGRVMFPVLEPFGSNLAAKLDNETDREQYVFQELYDSTRFRAQEQTQLNKYIIRGKYKSASGSEISLNAFNIPRGSVSVTAGGTKLVENQDYTVDYTLGRIKILNEGILNSGVPIQVNFENNTLFNVQTKTFMGATFDHRINKDFNVGGSVLHMTERPLTQKVNLGDEPISNTIWGLNTNYQTDLPVLTRIVDAIPGIDTKEQSRITAQGEFAHLIPGSPRGIEINGSETTYIDDFESAQTFIDLRGLTNWQLASVPGNQPDLFPEADVNDDVIYGYNRAKLSWYIIDPVFFANNAQTPENIRSNKDIISDHRQREVLIQEVFPNFSLNSNQPRNIAMFDLAYYPSERGPYNFDVDGEPGISSGMDNNGELLDPDTRWAGIMRPLQINNFEEQNIEFIQFWMMDPFLEDPNNAGGDLYFNLGSISEDVLKDGRQAFENGIDPVTAPASLDSTAWGYVPKVQPITEFFDNDPGSRPIQDVGMDALNTEQERSWSYKGNPTFLSRVEAAYGQGSQAYQQAFADPAGDNFKFYKGGDLDAANANVLERYKNFNGMEGNSSTEQVNGAPASFTNLPDKEDVNRDQTLTKTESYYQYQVSIRQSDLTLENQYITDIFETQVQVPNGSTKTARWIQFKIPIFAPDKRVGPINDFRSIRFMRMFMKNFNTPIVMRFARLDLVRGEWRRYPFSLDEIREEVPVDPTDNTAFAVNAVNLEENGNRQPIPYVLPPGIDRQVIFGASNLVQQNEQSLALLACNLLDGDARAVFRNLNFDMRTYGRLKMFVHGESAGEMDDLDDDDLNLFIRLGSDYNANFYEYEVPLKVTRWGTTDPNAIWPQANDVDIDFEVLKQLKLERDRVYRSNDNLTRRIRYRKIINGREISVVGSPNLGNVRTIMIGIRNPKKTGPMDPDDGLPKCAEVWVNELRLTDFDERGGWAANARVTAKLADFADISLSGQASSIGFGSLDQSVTERNKFEAFGYDLQSSFELGKFFSNESGVRIPLFFNYAEEWKNPMFNPLDPDIEFDDAIDNLETESQKDSLRQASQDYVMRKNINLTNVRKERRGGSKKQPMPWNIENFAVSYSFSETFRRSINTVFDSKKDHRASLNYTYQIRPKNVQPFKGIKSKYLTLIRDINFYYLPSRFTFRTEFLRTNAEAQQRNTDNPQIKLPTTYFKSFTNSRQYDLAFDITKSLKLDFNARMDARIDELNGPADTDSNRAVIRENLRNLGRPTRYHQTVNINWQIPINKLPFLDFINLTTRYSGDYDWLTNSLRALDPETDPDLYFGNTISNGNTVQVNGTLNMITLYNNVPYLKRVNSGQFGKKQQPQRQPQRRRQRVSEEEESNAANEEGEEEEEEDEGPSTFQKIVAGTARVLMMIRTASISYSQNNGMTLPGYTLEPNVFGMNTSNGWAPGPGFAFGFSQNPSLADELSGQNGSGNEFITFNTNQPNRFQTTFTENLNFRSTLEPVRDLRIEVTATKVNAENNSSIYRYHDETLDTALNKPTGFHFFNPMVTGNYSISFLAIGSSFERSTLSNGYSSAVYDKFLEYRDIISERLANDRAANPNFPDYEPIFNDGSDTASRRGYDGYSYLSQDVLLPAFLAAYGGYDPNSVVLNARPAFPLPNWQMNFSGLMKLDFFKKLFQTFTITHGYRSMYTISSFVTNLQLQQRQDLQLQGDDFRNDNGDFLPENQINSVTISENFSPLIGFNMRMKNNTSFKVEVKRDRMLNLSITNNQLTEMKGTEFVVGAGYIVRDVKLRFIRVGANRKPVQSNLELKLDFSLRDNQTVIRRIFENINQVTAGQNIYSIKFSADYQINTRITARFYYDQIVSSFKTSNAFPTNNITSGISIRFNLGQ